MTRPDIAEAVRACCKFMSNPGKPHNEALTRTFRYLKRHPSEGIKFEYKQGDDSALTAFVDASYANDVDNRRSVTGFVMFLSGGPISWSSTLQRVTAQSTAESEYIAAATCTKEIIWVRHLLREFDAPQSGPTKLFEDNLAAISLTGEDAHHKRTKHIDVRYHLLRDSVTQRIVDMEHVPTDEMIADLLTKPLGVYKFDKFKSRLVSCD